MGYTHYWEIQSVANESKYKRALSDIRKLVRENIDILANDMGDKGSKPILRGCVSFNGIEKQSHETFYLPNSVQKFDFERLHYKSFDFCKTNQKTYDFIVVACLCILKHYLSRTIEIRSDGDKDELKEGINLASSFLGVTLLNQFK